MSVQIESIESGILGKRMNLAIYCPAGFEKKSLPVLYFLHGRSGNESLLQWLGMDICTDQMIFDGEIKPLIIVCPNLDNSRGLNLSDTYQEVKGKYALVNKGRYEDYLIEEVIPFVDKNFCTDRNRSGRFIGGISSGGYTALSVGLRHQELFSKIGGHMPAVDLSYADEDECYFENEKMWLENDPITIAGRSTFDGLKVFLDDGKNDEGKFFRACEKLFHILKKNGVDVQNHLFEGHHDGEYVKANLKTYLRFYNQ